MSVPPASDPSLQDGPSHENQVSFDNVSVYQSTETPKPHKQEPGCQQLSTSMCPPSRDYGAFRMGSMAYEAPSGGLQSAMLGGLNVQSTIQPHLREIQQERERQAVKLQRSGDAIFMAVTVIVIILIFPFLISATMVTSPVTICLLLTGSCLVCLLVIAVYGCLAYKFREQPALQARGQRFLFYIFGSITVSQSFNLIAACLTFYDNIRGEEQLSLDVRIGLTVCVGVMFTADAFFFGTLVGRLRVLKYIFTSTTSYSKNKLSTIFHLPVVIFSILGLVLSITPCVHLVVDYDQTRLFWIFFGYLVISTTALITLSVYTWRTRKVSNLVSDWNQNIRTVIVYFVFEFGYALIIEFVPMEVTAQVALQQMGHQVALLIFLMDSFSATFLHLIRGDVSMADSRFVSQLMQTVRSKSGRMDRLAGSHHESEIPAGSSGEEENKPRAESV
eukprot:comp70848_c0_seq1/m.48120 comp70848_c0_seq1/g.48120  ORF comp70848_c0_seq1/g.48120 comp70848_c0_seq1/m.48120 type:complete len:446 (-) comp70848_c0_seq1:701-2038(-)